MGIGTFLLVTFSISPLLTAQLKIMGYVAACKLIGLEHVSYLLNSKVLCCCFIWLEGRIWSLSKGCSMFSVRLNVWSFSAGEDAYATIPVRGVFPITWGVTGNWTGSDERVFLCCKEWQLARLRFPRMVSASSFEAGSLVLGNEVCIVLATSNRLQETALVCWYRKVGKHKLDY